MSSLGDLIIDFYENTLIIDGVQYPSFIHYYHSMKFEGESETTKLYRNIIMGANTTSKAIILGTQSVSEARKELLNDDKCIRIVDCIKDSFKHGVSIREDWNEVKGNFISIALTSRCREEDFEKILLSINLDKEDINTFKEKEIAKFIVQYKEQLEKERRRLEENKIVTEDYNDKRSWADQVEDIVPEEKEPLSKIISANEEIVGLNVENSKTVDEFIKKNYNQFPYWVHDDNKKFKVKTNYSNIISLPASHIFSLLPIHVEQVCKYIQDIKNIYTIIDATAHIGCDSINLLNIFPKASIVSYEKDRLTSNILSLNLANNKPDSNVTVYNKSIVPEIISGKIKADLIYFDPPWGKNCKNVKDLSLELDENPIDLIIRHVFEKKLARFVVLKYPVNYNDERLTGINMFKLPFTVKTPLGKDAFKLIALSLI